MRANTGAALPEVRGAPRRFGFVLSMGMPARGAPAARSGQLPRAHLSQAMVSGNTISRSIEMVPPQPLQAP